MAVAFSALLWTACWMPADGCGASVQNYVWLPAGEGATAECRPIPYEPCEGDLILYDFDNRLYTAAYRLVGSGPPTHSGIVFRMPDGEPMILEAGSLSPRKVDLVEVQPRLKTYPGDLWVRRPHRPLTPEQSARLTEFALCQAGKGFATWRLRLEGLSHRTFSMVQYHFVDPALRDRPTWFCSELVMTGAVRAGLLPAEVLGPRMPDPRDIFRDKPHDLTPWYGPLRLITPEPFIVKPPHTRF